MTVPVPVPDGTTAPKAVLAAAVQDALDAIGGELTMRDCEVAAVAVVAALRLPDRDRETAAKALHDAEERVLSRSGDLRDHATCWSIANDLREQRAALRERQES